MQYEFIISIVSGAFWLGVAWSIGFVLMMRRQMLHYGGALLLALVMMLFCGLDGFLRIARTLLDDRLFHFLNPAGGVADYSLRSIVVILYPVVLSIANSGNVKSERKKQRFAIWGIIVIALLGIAMTVIGQFSQFVQVYVRPWFFVLALALFIILIFQTRDKSAEFWLLFIMAGLAFGVFTTGLLLRLIVVSTPGIIPLLETIALNAVSFTLILVVFLELQIHSPEITALDSCIDNLSHTTKNYVSDMFLKELQISNVSDLKVGDRIKKDVTIFFSDLRSFTELSEQLSPEQNFAFINSYLSRMVPLVGQNQGYIDKYLGDGIMAIFPEESGADNALKTAVQMQERIQEYNRHRANSGYKPVNLGVGINTGSIIMGVIGTEERYEATVISDAVNLASRLQSISKAFNIGIVISESTFLQISDLVMYRYRFIGKVRVKGKSIPISVFEIFNGLPDEIVERKLKVNTVFEQGMIAYYQKAYGNAVSLFKQALEILPEDGAAKFYLQASLQKVLLKKQKS